MTKSGMVQKLYVFCCRGVDASSYLVQNNSLTSSQCQASRHLKTNQITVTDLEYKDNSNIIYDQPLQEIAQKCALSKQFEVWFCEFILKKTQAIFATGYFVWDCELYGREIAKPVSYMIMIIQDSTHESLTKNLKLEIGVYVECCLSITGMV
jgi:hypothetical protein